MLTVQEAMELVKQVTLPKGAVARTHAGKIIIGNKHADISLSGDMLLNEDVFLLNLNNSLSALGPAMEQIAAEKAEAEAMDAKLKADMRVKMMHKRK